MKSVWKKFYNVTKISEFAAEKKGGLPESWKKIYIKFYKRFKNVQLPLRIPRPETSLADSLLERKSERNFSQTEIDLVQLSSLLFYSAGIIPGQTQDWDSTRRFYPSAGARYPLEIYLVSQKIKGLKSGLYHYLVPKHKLESLLTSNKLKNRMGNILGQEWVKESALILIITAVFKRTTNKYGERGHRHILIEAGHLAQNLYLMAASMKIKICAVGGFIEEKIAKLLDIDEEDEYVVYVICLGK